MIPPRKTKKVLFWLGMSLPMLALVAMTWLVHQSGGRFNNSFNWVMQTYKVMDLFQQTQTHIVDAEANQRGFLLTGHKEYLEPYQNAMQAVHNDLIELNSFVRNDPAQAANVRMLEKFVETELVFDPDKVTPVSQDGANDQVASGVGHSGYLPHVAALAESLCVGDRRIDALQKVNDLHLDAGDLDEEDGLVLT